MIDEIFAPRVGRIDQFLSEYLTQLKISTHPAVHLLRESMSYSAMNGGKRFRPVLSILVAEALGHQTEKVVPYGAALEMIHTYSLIHDDLPAMDNDDIRRGKPTNHKIYGEALALLAGDALLTEAFSLLTEHYSSDPELLTFLVKNIASYAGIRGMVGGQAIDLEIQKNRQQLLATELLELHCLKTGALIIAAVTGAAMICQAPAIKLEELKLYADNLGLAFQVADDLLDYDETDIETGSFPGVFGLAETQRLLAQYTERAIAHLQNWDHLADPLRKIAKYNQMRSV
jgi:geranylgeranyl diphosphate synthase, type II